MVCNCQGTVYIDPLHAALHRCYITIIPCSIISAAILEVEDKQIIGLPTSSFFVARLGNHRNTRVSSNWGGGGGG